MKRIVLMLFLAVLSLCSWAQQVMTVKGTVKDTGNNPLSGVSVVIKGSPGGTMTDVNGNFSTTAAKGKVLVFSYVGLQKTEVTVGNSSNIQIVMEDDDQLNEVVVVGYGTVKRKDLTGAVASLTGKEMQADVAKSTSGALQGRIAGVSVSSVSGQPGAGMSIDIRGLSSLGSNTPLYVIDGVYGDINMVDPSDIASLDVLKDAAAAAIYGSRAANGVVLITTKGGKRNTAATITASLYTGVQKIAKKLDVLDAQEWKNIMNQSGYLPKEAIDFQGTGTNWQDEVYRTAPISKANVGITGGSETSTYSVSAGYINQKGILINSGYESFNLRTKNTFSFFNNHLRVGNTLMLNTSEKQDNRLTITDALRQNPLLAVYDSNQLGGYAGILPWMKNMDNPVGASRLFDNKLNKTDILLNAYGEVDLGIEGLKYKLNFGYNRNIGNYYNANAPYNFGSGAIQSRLSQSANFNTQWLIENTLHFDRTFGKHTISALLGYSSQDNKNPAFGASRTDIPFGTSTIGAGSTLQQGTSGSLQEYSLVSLFSRAMYSYDSRYLFSASVRRDGSSRFADGHRYGVFPSVSVGWNIMNEQFFGSLKNTINELKVRMSYGVLGNQEIGNYATQSISSSGINYIQGGTWWMGSNTGIVWPSPKNLTWEETKTKNIGLDGSFFGGKLSLTADYYIQQTDDVLLSIAMPGSTGINGSPTMNAGIIKNKGFEMLLNHKNTIGEVSYNIGVNGSVVRNRVEAITVGSSKQEFGGYNPQGEGTITWAKVGDPIGAFYLIKTAGLFQSDAEAQAYKTPAGKVIQPNAKAGDIRFIDYNGDGQITDDDRQYAGSPFPDFSYGIRGSVAYKGFDLGIFFDGMKGNKIYNYTRARMESMNEFTNFGANVLNAWTPENRDTDVPRFTQQDENKNSRRVSDRWLEDGSFFRLKTVELGYTFSNNLVSKIHVRDLRVFTSMENVFIATKYKGYTPDLGQNDDQNGGGSSTMSRGTDHGRFPSSRTLIFGLQLSF
ncbi:TonB-dependent receptor [Pedobacter sp. N36a]|uniref:SusC/RagA family TonB-linked outer membrane protein n=1 Tax=Pedobacter sp. N36a TaxID=2767996 RepID=UPI001656F68B|nr:TonB-dependent receptor [Pedobacter sp. N36a]MBC8987746.1 TonB-dependent receptor [Pedobacter sp. N36a]